MPVLTAHSFNESIGGVSDHLMNTEYSVNNGAEKKQEDDEKQNAQSMISNTDSNHSNLRPTDYNETETTNAESAIDDEKTNEPQSSALNEMNAMNPIHDPQSELIPGDMKQSADTTISDTVFLRFWRCFVAVVYYILDRHFAIFQTLKELLEAAFQSAINWAKSADKAMIRMTTVQEQYAEPEPEFADPEEAVDNTEVFEPRVNALQLIGPQQIDPEVAALDEALVAEPESGLDSVSSNILSITEAKLRYRMTEALWITGRRISRGTLCSVSEKQKLEDSVEQLVEMTLAMIQRMDIEPEQFAMALLLLALFHDDGVCPPIIDGAFFQFLFQNVWAIR